jgi:hypothetical protein
LNLLAAGTAFTDVTIGTGSEFFQGGSRKAAHCQSLRPVIEFMDGDCGRIIGSHDRGSARARAASLPVRTRKMEQRAEKCGQSFMLNSLSVSSVASRTGNDWIRYLSFPFQHDFIE